MKVSLPEVYSQFDDRWKTHLLGLNTEPQYDFYNYGCLLSCLSSISRYFGKTEDPVTLNQKLIDVKGYVNFGAYVDGSLSKIYPDIIEQPVPTPQALTEAQFNDIKNALDRNLPVVFGLDYNPKTLAVDYHFVIAIDYDPKDINNFTIADPLGGRIHSLKDYLGWFKPNAANSIEKYLIYTGPIAVSQVPATPQPAPEASEPSTPPPSAEVTPEQPIVTDVPNVSQPENPTHDQDQWSQLVQYLEINKDPSDATYEDAKKVIAGFKSAKTDYYNKQLAAEKKAKGNEVELLNLQEDIRRLKNQLTTEAKLNKAQIDAIKQNTPSYDKLTTEFKGAIANLTGELEAKVNEVKDLRIAIAHAQVEKDVESALEVPIAQTVSIWKTDVKDLPSLFMAGLKRLIVIKHKTI